MKNKAKKQEKKKNQTGSRDWYALILFTVILMAVLLLYGRTVEYDYTYLDDNELILKNQHILRHLGNLAYAFQEDVFFSFSDAYYRPMLTTSFLIDGQFGVHTLVPFHVSNLIIHVLCAWLVFVLLRKLTQNRHMAGFFAVLFAVHPVLSQAVAWVPGRNDSLLALFVLAAFLSLLVYMEKKGWFFYLSHMFFFVLALFTKETVLLFVFVCMAYLLLIVRPQNVWRIIMKLGLGWSLATGLYLIMRSIAMVHPIQYSFREMFLSTWISLPALLQFLGKIFFPFNLSVLPTMLDTTYLYGIGVVLLLTLACWYKRKTLDWRMVALGGVWFLMFIIPSFIRPNADIMVNFLEHRTYLPIIGIFLIAGGLLRGAAVTSRVFIIAAASVILLMSIVNWFHVPHFQNRLVFWNNAASNSPNSPLAQRNLGAMLYLDGDKDRAAHYFRKALALNPFEPMANMNLGLIAMDQNNLALAESLFVREATINPYYANAYFNLGILHYKKGQADQAAAAWERTLQLDANFEAAYINLIVLLYENQRIEPAKAYMRILRSRNMAIPAELIRLVGF